MSYYTARRGFEMICSALHIALCSALHTALRSASTLRSALPPHYTLLCLRAAPCSALHITHRSVSTALCYALHTTLWSASTPHSVLPPHCILLCSPHHSLLRTLNFARPLLDACAAYVPRRSVSFTSMRIGNLPGGINGPTESTSHWQLACGNMAHMPLQYTIRGGNGRGHYKIGYSTHSVPGGAFRLLP